LVMPRTPSVPTTALERVTARRVFFFMGETSSHWGDWQVG
jgi:hypothetical protein